ncbi:hypothetical protein G9464_16355 [Halostella sp. JP-L12]|uniref:hypothetical protein n=1 Tax=Halostella TaxID=1843185 RepID=UPI000EF78294|nr:MULTISPECIES: hypothetical protein [Halostella]NHN49153.1 hypothetical protein [Halostella sp. JP-L12]
MTGDPAPYDHVWATDAAIPDGTYRVVGVEDGVTLLRVGDASGKRVHDGRVFTLSRAEYAALPEADNPDEESALRRWGLVALAAAVFLVSLSPDAADALGVSQSALRNVVVVLVAIDLADRFR